ncbi:MAG TPA: sigma-70 family RNA polymerase sigma factor [Thermoanaerobaculia bacterium]|jgi:RNA polymerase sigma factor (sigma-70 family)|nr:sigma-70 family RNA polymerase sigma factor [Thermoanaerobaculia bacterium]
MTSGLDAQGVSQEPAPKAPPILSPVADATAGFDTIYDDHAPLLRAIARTRFHIPDADIDGLVHDVFVSFLTSPSRVRDPRSYLVGGICNASRNYWRRREREDALFVEIDENVACDENVQHDVSRTLTLNAALARIGERCRDVLQRYYFESESTVTIAKAIGATPSNVLYILHNCRKRARAFLDQMTLKR